MDERALGIKEMTATEHVFLVDREFLWLMLVIDAIILLVIV